jgi:2-iminobutanoate/2-iminopropanoate deaminase
MAQIVGLARCTPEVKDMKTTILKVCMTSLVVSCSMVSVYTQTGAQKPTRPERRVVKLPGRTSTAPISPATIAGDLVFTSGQIGIDPKTGQMPETLEAQAEQVLVNLKTVLEAAGTDMSRVLKTTVFLADMNDYGAMNEVYKRHFKADPPARSAVQVAKLPANAKIEIEAVALLK